MKSMYAVVVLASLAACGGTSVDAPPVVRAPANAAPTTQQPVTDAPAVSSSEALASPSTTVPDVRVVAEPSADATFGSLLNGIRLDNGAPPVTYNARLNQAAQLHANDMLANDYFSHIGLNGSNVGTRVRDAGYNFQRVGENIAIGYQTEEGALDGWVNSPDHQRNNIDPNFEEFGLGYARDGRDTRWVLVLGTEK